MRIYAYFSRGDALQGLPGSFTTKIGSPGARNMFHNPRHDFRRILEAYVTAIGSKVIDSNGTSQISNPDLVQRVWFH
jgi:hypothetical protein